jgi:hypothetical protein
MKAPAQARSICQACINETVDNEDMRNEWVTADSEVASLVLNDDKVMGEPLEEGDVTYTIISDRVIVGKNASVDSQTKIQCHPENSTCVSSLGCVAPARRDQGNFCCKEVPD